VIHLLVFVGRLEMSSPSLELGKLRTSPRWGGTEPLQFTGCSPGNLSLTNVEWKGLPELHGTQQGESLAAGRVVLTKVCAYGLGLIYQQLVVSIRGESGVRGPKGANGRLRPYLCGSTDTICSCSATKQEGERLVGEVKSPVSGGEGRPR